MAFTAQELANIANAALDYYIKGPALSQTIQKKPLLDKLIQKQKAFSGGKDYIIRNVKGAYTTTPQGYSHDDTVTYGNPANMKQGKYAWKEIHAGIALTLTELKRDGISVVDSAMGDKITEHDGRELHVISDIMSDKLEDMGEGWARGMDLMFHKDGSQDAKEVPGIRSFILDDPTAAGAVAGIDATANTWWRNRASLSMNVSTPSNMVITKTLKSEHRQLTRYGGNPNLYLAGSDFLDAIDAELVAKGEITNTGWDKAGGIDLSISDPKFRGGMIMYDPTLDDLSLEKYMFVLDQNNRGTVLMPMKGEDRKKHAPARPEDKYVLYRAMTWTGGLCCWQRNANEVFSIA